MYFTKDVETNGYLFNIERTWTFSAPTPVENPHRSRVWIVVLPYLNLENQCLH